MTTTSFNDEPSPSPAGARCVVCDGSRGAVVVSKSGYDLVACPCGGVYLSPKVDERSVDPSVDFHPASFYALPADRKIRWLAKTRSDGLLLEVGCGEGHFLRAAQRRGFRVAGIEIDRQRAERVATELGIEVENEPIERSRWPPASCDIVYHCDLLSHFPDPVLALKCMAKLLKPEGVLFFEVGLVGDLAPVWYRWIPEHSIPRHRWFFSHRALERLLERAGLGVVRIKKYGLAPQVVAYRGLSTIFQRAKRMTESRSLATDPQPDGRDVKRSARYRQLVDRYDNFMRFSVGAVAPKIGPLTALVIAKPVGRD